MLRLSSIFVALFLMTVPLLAGAPALAPDGSGRLIDFTQVLTDAYGRSYPPQCVRNDPDANPPKCQEHEPFTLGLGSVTALSAAIDGDRTENPSAKAFRDLLALKIADAELAHAPVSLGSKEISTIQERAAKVFPDAVLVMRIWSLLEPDSVKNAK